MNLRYLGLLLAVPAALTLSPTTYLRADSASPDVSLSGTLASVDAAGTHADIVTDSGLRYTLDTDHADISPRGVDALQPGERVQITGEPLSDGTIRAGRIQVSDALPAAPPPAANAPDASAALHLRGTVVSVDQQGGSFVVHVNDHTWTVFVDDSTGLSPAPVDDGRLPLQAGDRVTVSGLLRADGTVVADTVVAGPADPAGVDLTGRVVQPSSRYGSRDIKVRDGAGREVTIHVPQDIPIVRDGRPISVHSLTANDVIRVEGFPDGVAVQATRIDTVANGGEKL